MTSKPRKNILLLFDVDGTVTKARQIIKPDTEHCLLKEIKPHACIGFVSGSDIHKTAEQLGGNHKLDEYDYVFSENGLVFYMDGKQMSSHSIVEHMGEEKIQQFINFSLKYLSELQLPVKRGHFVDFRTGVINLCPVGRSCTQAERDQFEVYDKDHHIRENLRLALIKQFPDIGLTFSIGGQISLDVFPTGWDKRFCLQHVENLGFKEIHFFGDQTGVGGNDQQLFEDPRVIGHTVLCPEDTVVQLRKLFGVHRNHFIGE